MNYAELRVVERLLESGRPPDLVFAEAEYAERVATLRRNMASEAIDVLIVTNVSNIGYLTGYDSGVPSAHIAVVVPLSGAIRFHCADLEAPCMLATGTVSDIALYRYYDTPDPIVPLAALARDATSDRARVGVEMGWTNTLNAFGLDARSFQSLVRELPNHEIVDATQLVMRQRLVKSPTEIAAMRTAGRYTVAAMKAGIEAVHDGVHENELAATLYHAMMEAGSENPALDPLIIAGDRLGWAPHLAFRRRRLANGDALYFELSGTHDRYNAPQARTMSIGKPSDDVAAFSDAVTAAVKLLHANIRPGRTGHDVATTVLHSGLLDIDGAGNSGTYGYSVGLAFKPVWTEASFYFSPGNHAELKPGMTLHTPISLFRPAHAAVLYSETVLVTEAGCEVLTPGVPMELTSR